MENIKIKTCEIKTCPECNEELQPNEKYVCDSCKKMILEWRRKNEDD